VKRRSVLLVLGSTGSGKSYYVKSLLESIGKLFIFDPRHEYTGGIVFEDFQELCDYAYEHIEDESFRYICRFVKPEDYENAARLIWILRDGTLLLEESELFLSSFDRDAEHPINFLVSQGRHRSISIIAISRRPSELSIKLRAVVDCVVSFKQTEPNDLRYCQIWGFDIEKLPTLQRGEYESIGENPYTT
jgi:hypothetical protein